MSKSKSAVITLLVMSLIALVYFLLCLTKSDAIVYVTMAYAGLGFIEFGLLFNRWLNAAPAPDTKTARHKKENRAAQEWMAKMTIDDADVEEIMEEINE